MTSEADRAVEYLEQLIELIRANRVRRGSTEIERDSELMEVPCGVFIQHRSTGAVTYTFRTTVLIDSIEDGS